MSEKNEITFNLVKSILFGLALPIAFCWLFFDPKNINPIIDEYRLIAEDRITTIGIITKAKSFEDYVESNEGRTIQRVSGYEFSYTFSSNKDKKIISESFTYEELPNNKQISQIPFQVNIEYLEEDPKINRIVGLNTNNKSLWDVLRKMLFLPLMLFIFCCYFAFKIIERGVNKYRIEIKELYPMKNQENRPEKQVVATKEQRLKALLKIAESQRAKKNKGKTS